MEAEAYPAVHRVERTHWFFVARRRIIASLVKRYFPPRKNACTLDVGGGTGGLVDVLKPYGSLIGLDYSDEALSYYRQYHPDVCRGDAVHLPFKSESIDFLIALDVLEHLEDDRAGLTEFFRVLKMGGRALVTVPAFKFLWGRLDDLGRHKRRYTRSELCGKASQAGFRVSKSSYMNSLLVPIVLVNRLSERFRRRWMSADSDLQIPSKPINTILTGLFGFEERLLSKIDLLLGVSVVSVLEK